MKVKDILLSVLGIATILVLPFADLLPFFGYVIPVLLVVWLALKSAGENFADIGFSFRRFEFKALLIGVPLAWGALAFMQLAFFPALELIVDWEYEDLGLNDTIRESPWNYALMVVMGVLIGGLYEEIVFHGFMFTRLEKLIPGPFSTHFSFVLTATFFGAYHFQLGALGLINALLVGAVYLGLFLLFKRNLWYPIICHGVYNSTVMTLMYLGYI